MRVWAKVWVAAAVALVCLGGRADPARAAEETLIIHHFLGPNAPAHAAFIVPWAERVERRSGGRIAVEIFPAMSMGGRPPELYGQVRDGFADIVWTLPGYTPGVFPRSEVFELATVHRGSARATNLAIQDVWPLIAADFDAVHPLLVHVHAGNALHVVGRPVTALADVAGLKLRTPSRTGAWTIEAWGADPVGMPVPGLPMALAKGIVDGALLPFELVPALKLHELTDFSAEGADGSRFGTSVLLFAMNKERYAGLSDELRAVIDAESGRSLAVLAGEAWDRVEAAGKALQAGEGGRVIGLDPAAKADFDTRSLAAVDRWIDEAEDHGIDGRSLVDAARAAVAAHSAHSE